MNEKITLIKYKLITLFLLNRLLFLYYRKSYQHLLFYFILIILILYILTWILARSLVLIL